MNARFHITGLAIPCGTFASAAMAQAPVAFGVCAACHSVDYLKTVK